MSYAVQFAPEVQDQLGIIEQHIVEAGLPATAARYVDAIIADCEGLATFPLRGRRRDDLMPGLRITHYRGHAVIAYLVDTDAEIVSIVGVFYGGQDYEKLLQDDIDESQDH
jgi:toxin ParE1/3/4